MDLSERPHEGPPPVLSVSDCLKALPSFVEEWPHLVTDLRNARASVLVKKLAKATQAAPEEYRGDLGSMNRDYDQVKDLGCLGCRIINCLEQLVLVGISDIFIMQRKLQDHG